MINNHLIIMPFNLPWNWSADYQQQTCLVLNKNNFIVAYMHHHAHFFLKKRRRQYPKIKNVIFYSPTYFIPFRRFAIVEKLNQLLCVYYLWVRYGLRKKTLLWMFDPVFHFYTYINKINQSIITIYDCVDYHWSALEKVNAQIREHERSLISRVDLFFVNSDVLYRIHSSIRTPDKKVPLGFALPEFEKFKSQKLQIKLKNSQNKPIIGFHGSLDWRLDIQLVNQLVIRNPDLLFVFIGPLKIQDLNEKNQKQFQFLFKQSNVQYIGEISRNKLINLIRSFDVGIIPYNTKDLHNRYCYPMKTLEYLYFRKPIISTPIKELQLLSKSFKDLIHIAKGANDWNNTLHLLSRSGRSKFNSSILNKFLQANSWKNKLEVISNVVS